MIQIYDDICHECLVDHYTYICLYMCRRYYRDAITEHMNPVPTLYMKKIPKSNLDAFLFPVFSIPKIQNILNYMMFKKLVATIKASKIDNLTTIIRGTNNFVICIACYLIHRVYGCCL